MKNKRVQWKSFNINMPSELIPIYDFLQNELNFILSNDETRALLDKIDLSKLRGDVWRDLRDSLKFRIKDWPLHNKTWHSYILFENIRREIQSKQEAIIIWNELVKNDFNINEELLILREVILYLNCLGMLHSVLITQFQKNSFSE